MRHSSFALFFAAAALVAIVIIGVACSGPASAPTVSPTPATQATTSPAATDSPRSPSTAPSPRPTPNPTPVPVPPKPTGVTFDTQGQLSDDESMAEMTQTVTWRAPRTG